MNFITEMPVLTEHINYGNHLAHDALVSILHEARVRFLKTHGTGEVMPDGMGLIMAELTAITLCRPTGSSAPCRGRCISSGYLQHTIARITVELQAMTATYAPHDPPGWF